jgi:iron complex transport system substrate-binding protein
MRYLGEMHSHFDNSKLETLIGKRGWNSLNFVKHKNYCLTIGPLDFLPHHGPSFITEAIPWLFQSLREANY